MSSACTYEKKQRGNGLVKGKCLQEVEEANGFLGGSGKASFGTK